MAAHGARRLGRMNNNLSTIIGVELMCAAQGIEFRAPLKTSAQLQKAMEIIRRDVPAIKQDRYLAPDIGKAAELVANATLVEALGLEGFVVGGVE